MVNHHHNKATHKIQAHSTRPYLRVSIETLEWTEFIDCETVQQHVQYEFKQAGYIQPRKRQLG